MTYPMELRGLSAGPGNSGTARARSEAAPDIAVQKPAKCRLMTHRPAATESPCGGGRAHGGESNFQITSYGDRRERMVNEIGPYDGSVPLCGGVFVEVVAHGNWSIST